MIRLALAAIALGLALVAAPSHAAPAACTPAGDQGEWRGPVRGFAMTLAIGLMANVFTSVFVSRTLFDLALRPRTG